MKAAIGKVKCPECGYEEAEIREDKNGNAFRYCPNCNAQYFTRGRAEADKRLRESMRAPTMPAPAAPAAPAPAAPGKRQDKPFSLNDL